MMLLGGYFVSTLAADKEKVYVTRTESMVTIGNGFLSREFSLADGKVRTRAVENKRTGHEVTRILPGTASEEFVIRTLSADSLASDISSSALSLQEIQVADERKGGKKLVFHYKSFRHQEVDWQVNMVLTLEEGKHYMRKYLEITVPGSQRHLARLDYIDFEPMNLPEGYAVWTHPVMEQGVGGVSGYYISLGQPVYIQGMFFGLEFPASETEIEGNRKVRIRYYSGKSFEMLASEGRLADSGTLTTWKEVTGATRSTDMDVIQADFFSYIHDIAVPVDFRIQYNSWYDFMLDINENNILDSFREVERGLTQNGVRPIDSYVVDDGWNAYGPWQEENKAKFWSFNSKFPNELSTPSDLSHRLSSNFGLWLGPRGGYNYYIKFARFLEENGNGKLNRNSSDICTNHKVYSGNVLCHRALGTLD